ncbi:MAG: 2-dehydropantoate 2-reductase [Heliomarina sp.]|uniref:2-dehydropantoate 2-reductase n=1 Tax=Heliomarina sp. TaxID=2917556 RepID=UPI004059B67D
MRQPIVIAGAGSIGCFVGGLLAAAGRDVRLLARARVAGEIQAHGLNLTGFDGMSVALETIEMSADPAVLGDAGVILVTVKTGATRTMAELIATHASRDAVIVSLQNGLDAIETLRSALPGYDVRAGMVPFNVVPMGEGRFHRASSGDILTEAGQPALALGVPGLSVRETPHVTGYQWGKLLINLGNAPNALSGLTLVNQLSDRYWRHLLADQMREALAVLKAAGIQPRSMTPLPAGWVPIVLDLPTALFRRIASKMLTIDPEARTSMSYDLMAGRRSEIDAFQGRIVTMGERLGVATPLNRAMQWLVLQAEDKGAGLPGLSVEEIRRSAEEQVDDRVDEAR